MKLVIAEKPSVGKSIAAVLKADKRENGFFIGNGYIVSWCIGHLLEQANTTAYDEKYKKWNYSHLPIVPQEWKYTVSSEKSRQLKILNDLMKRSDVETIVNAADAGREGELIFRLVYEKCECKKPIQRLWVSSMEECSLLEGFRNLRDGADYENLYQSALCRSRADWLVGINATQLFSILYKDTLNVGRVQSPTLALLVKRQLNIDNFIREPFYVPEINCGDFVASSEKTKDKLQAETIRNACEGKTATIHEIEQKNKTIAPPKLYDLTTLQREANRTFDYTAQQSLAYIRSLYEKKLATYQIGRAHV